jgi:hypothetical protein
MNDWKMNDRERKIINAFISRYFVSSAKTGGEKRGVLRLRSASVFPDFETASPDEKESFLEAVESLERRGLLTLNWEKHGKGERLRTLSCADMGKLFTVSGGKDPAAEAEKIRIFFRDKARASGNPFLDYLSEHFGPSEAGRGLDHQVAADFIRFLEIVLKPEPSIGAAPPPEQTVNITTRALSVSLYNDSKRLERLLNLFNPLLSRAQKQGIPVPALSVLERSLPDTMIAGKLIFEYGNNEETGAVPPLVNAAGLILGFPLQSVRKLRKIRTIDAKSSPAVLTIENKETFYALGSPQNHGKNGDHPSEFSRYDCFLYVGGYPNQAAAAMIKNLAVSGFRFYHAGDLDPDGILILQNITNIAEKPVVPVRMDAAAFDSYLPWARPLAGSVLGQLKKIQEDTRKIPGLAGLIRRIEETGRGVEQEIVDYRGECAAGTGEYENRSVRKATDFVDRHYP